MRIQKIHPLENLTCPKQLNVVIVKNKKYFFPNGIFIQIVFKAFFFLQVITNIGKSIIFVSLLATFRPVTH